MTIFDDMKLSKEELLARGYVVGTDIDGTEILLSPSVQALLDREEFPEGIKVARVGSDDQ